MTFSKLIRKLKKESNQLKVICIGLDNAGKTTILQYLCEEPIENIEPTFGYSVYNGKFDNLDVLIYDIGGQSIFRPFWSNYFEKCDGVIFVYDISDKRDCISELRKVIEEVPDVPILILANKIDLVKGKYNAIIKNNINNGSMNSNTENNSKLQEIREFKVSGINKETLKEPFTWFFSQC